MQIGIDQTWHAASATSRPPRPLPTWLAFPIIIAASTALWAVLISAFVALG